MYKTAIQTVLLLLISFLAACTPSVSIPQVEKVSVSATRITKPAPTVMITLTATATEPVSSATPANTPTPTPSPTPTVAPTATPGVALHCEAPLPVALEAPSLLETGSILVQPKGEEGIWILDKSGQPRLVFTPGFRLALSSRDLSKDGRKFAFSDPSENYHAILDLQTGDITKLPWEEAWRWIFDWSHDNRVKIHIQSEYLYDEGIKSQTILMDPTTLQTELVIQDISLPGFDFQSNNPYRGFASFSPDGTMVLYTATVTNPVRSDYVLKDIVRDIELWRYEGSESFLIAESDWASDSDSVLMMLSSSNQHDGGQEPIQIASLTINTLQLDILAESPKVADYYPDIRQISWSPDRHYVLFELIAKSLNDGLGFVLDTQTGTIRQVCESGFFKGRWLPEANQIVYVMKTEDGSEAEVKLLDVATWQSQLLWHIDDNGGRDVNVIGWTPVEFPDLVSP